MEKDNKTQKIEEKTQDKESKKKEQDIKMKTETKKIEKEENLKKNLVKPENKEKNNDQKEESKTELKESKNKEEMEVSEEESNKETKEENAPKEKKKIPQKVEKKEFAIVNVKDKKFSTKHAIAICKFIKNKTIEKAIFDLEQVILMKNAIPMKGEIPHRKGMAGGRYPIKASKEFINILKSLSGNCINCKVDNPVITIAKADLASRPYRRGGSRKFKRTHVTLVAREKKEVNTKQEKNSNKEKKLEENKTKKTMEEKK